MMVDNEKSTPTEKAAEVTYLIIQGQEMTTSDVAERFGTTWQGADKLMNKVSRRVPIYKDERDTRWKKL